MAAIPVVFNGVDGNGNPVTLVGSLAYSDRGVGGGPMPGGPDRPVDPGYGYPEKPVDPGYGIPGPPYPDVPPPEGTPDSDGFIKAPPPGGGWGYHQTYQWLFDPPPGSAQPK